MPVDISGYINYGIMTLVGLLVAALFNRVAGLIKDFKTGQESKLDNINSSISDLRDEIQKEREQRIQHELVTDAEGTIAMRDHLINECNALCVQGCADYNEKKRVHDDYSIYERLVTLSGTENGIMDAYIANVDALPEACNIKLDRREQCQAIC